MRNLIGVAAGLALLASSPGGAATFVVNSNQDAVDAVRGNGVCATSGNVCTLRAAVQEANALDGNHTINMPSGTFQLASTLQNLTVDRPGVRITILGAASLDTELIGHPSAGFLYVATGATARVERATIRDGHQAAPGGCFYNHGSLELIRVWVTNCTSGQDGGAVRNDGTLYVEGSTFYDNHAATTGGALQSPGSATLVDVLIGFNTAASAPGIAASPGGAVVALTDTTLQGNQATGGDGGAILMGVGTHLSLERVTLSANTATANGGALLVLGTATLANVTFSGNHAGGAGGAIAARAYSSTTLRNVTITGGSDGGSAGAVYLEPSWPISFDLANTLMASNGAHNCNRTLTSAGHNLESHDDCGLHAAGDLVNATPLLGPLANNLGVTKTVALLAGSPGIDDGTNALGPTTDQRGVWRHDGDGDGTATSDIGAYEFSPVLFFDGFERALSMWWHTAS